MTEESYLLGRGPILDFLKMAIGLLDKRYTALETFLLDSKEQNRLK